MVEVAPASYWPDMEAVIPAVFAAKKGLSPMAGAQAGVNTSALFIYRFRNVVPKRMEAMKAAVTMGLQTVCWSHRGLGGPAPGGLSGYRTCDIRHEWPLQGCYSCCRRVKCARREACWSIHFRSRHAGIHYQEKYKERR